ncbi:uncharacterized protein [Aegilops tauschii subsp. strangulata]|uniref:FAF domain-containing protein n=1 Tax=Aegilops tauschii subsp. strangulata TaxID=200361 RepID=A0A453JJH2_AEGTS|nr:protein FAF-like, chloroplastic [Aegilops tauschii subsp. strangulata]
MAATACAYGYDGGLVPPPPPPAQAMDAFDDSARGRRHCPIIHDHYSIINGLVMPPPPPPPPPPPLPPFHLPSGASSKAAASRHPGLCTEGLGSESSESSGDLDLGDIVADDDIEDCKRRQQDDQEETLMPARKRVFPPPISVIGAAGKPWQYLRAQRGGGRLVLREVRIPSRELLHACREDGRLKLHFAHPEPEEHHHLADDDEEEECNNQQTAI